MAVERTVGGEGQEWGPGGVRLGIPPIWGCARRSTVKSTGRPGGTAFQRTRVRRRLLDWRVESTGIGAHRSHRENGPLERERLEVRGEPVRRVWGDAEERPLAQVLHLHPSEETLEFHGLRPQWDTPLPRVVDPCGEGTGSGRDGSGWNGVCIWCDHSPSIFPSSRGNELRSRTSRYPRSSKRTV